MITEKEIVDNKSVLTFVSLDILTFADDASGLLPELLYIFKEKDLMNFFKIFSGRIIKVPTYEEFKVSLAVIEYFYYSKVKKLSDNKIFSKYIVGFSPKENLQIRVLFNKWFNSLSDEKKEMYLNSKGIKDCLESK